MIAELTNHLWQSTVFAAAVALLAAAFRKNRAEVRYWLWFSASVKFLIPFALLLTLGTRLWNALPAAKIHAPVAASSISAAVVQFTQPFSESFASTPTSSAPFAHAANWILFSLLVVWVFGFFAIALIRISGWLRIRAAVRASTPIHVQIAAPAAMSVRSSPGLLEPGVIGFFRPVLVLPEGIVKTLTPPQLEAVLAHEQSHIRRRDNLTSALHMLVEAVFWFHPLVWWIGARLVEERERACDEAVLRLGSEPQVYAEGILNVCKSYLESPLRCVSGVTGSDLKKRIRAILTDPVAGDLNLARKTALIFAGMAALTVPIFAGLIGAPSIRAQSQTQNTAAISYDFKYDVVSIKPTKSAPPRDEGFIFEMPPDGFRVKNLRLVQLLSFAYGAPSSDNPAGFRPDQFWYIPDWANSARFDVEAKMDASVADALNKLNPDQRKIARAHMLQALLADRFKLVLHRETRNLPIYLLVIAKNGPKLKEPPSGETYPTIGDPDHPNPNLPRTMAGMMGMGGGSEGTLKITSYGAPFPNFAKMLSGPLWHNIVDKTGLTGKYDFTLQWTPDGASAPAAGGGDGAQSGTGVPSVSEPSSWPSIFTAIQQQLGLKLEPAKGPVEIIVIDHVERPSGN
ncbi:MAG: M56 family metallopeptidase [Candidatus Acidiferrales bacterium]